MLLLLVACRQESDLSDGFSGPLSYALLKSDIVRALWSCFRGCGSESWQNSLHALSIEEQDFVLDMFMGETADAAEHAKQEVMLTEVIGQHGVYGLCKAEDRTGRRPFRRMAVSRDS